MLPKVPAAKTTRLATSSARVPFWGWGDLTDISGFLTHLLRREYGTFSLGNEHTGNQGEFFSRFLLFLKTIPVSVMYLGVFLIPLGMKYSFQRSSFQLQKLAGWFVGVLAFYLNEIFEALILL